MIVLVVTGGRDYADRKTVAKVMRKYVEKAGRYNILVVHGAADGLDTMVGKWCNKNGIPCVAMKAPWKKWPKAAGPIRNQWMLDYLKPTHGLVFPGGAGTADMHTRMKKAKLQIKVIEP